MTICRDCADTKKLIPKDKIAGCWIGECPYCRNQELAQEKAWRSSDNKSLSKEIEDLTDELIIIRKNRIIWSKNK